MIGIVGIVIILVMVFGGYMLAGGKMTLILKALPFELMMIGGAAIGAFTISNDMGGIKHTAKDLAKVFKGVKWKNRTRNSHEKNAFFNDRISARIFERGSKRILPTAARDSQFSPR